MAELVGRALVEAYVRAVEEQDFDKMETLIADDFIEEMPQSGERIRGKTNHLAVLRAYPGGVGTIDPTSRRLVGSEDRWVATPSFTIQRIEGSGDLYTYVGTARYPSGDTWQIIAIAELRGPRVAKVTAWYARPFEAPEWRTPFVERFPSFVE